MPRRRAPRVFPERVVSAIESMIPGTVGGRVSSAAPITGSDVDAADAGALGPAELGSGIDFLRDRFALTAAGVQDLTLTADPLTDSEHVYLNGLEQDRDTDYTLDGQTVSVLAPMSASIGDVVDVRYACLSGAPITPGAVELGENTFGTTSTGTLTLDAPVEAAVGDLILGLIAGDYGDTLTLPAGWTTELAHQVGIGGGVNAKWFVVHGIYAGEADFTFSVAGGSTNDFAGGIIAIPDASTVAVTYQDAASGATSWIHPAVTTPPAGCVLVYFAGGGSNTATTLTMDPDCGPVLFDLKSNYFFAGACAQQVSGVEVEAAKTSTLNSGTGTIGSGVTIVVT